jgi:TDG/mug DNA glycosylase family protein
MFVDRKRQAEFEREVGKVQPLWRDKFLYLLKFIAVLEQGQPDAIERVIRGGIEKKHLTEKALASPLKTLGQSLNFGVKDVTFAIWWSDKEKRFAPGLFCPDAITALHALALTWIGKRGGIAACARCGTTFIKSRKKQTHCGALCENAAARARSREKSKDPKPSESVLPDVVGPDLTILFCGTAVGEASMKAAAYYAGPGNRFWTTLQKVGLTPTEFKPGDYPKLLKLQMGLTDLVKTACGNDCDLSEEGFDRTRLRKLVSEYRPRILAFTSKRAAGEFIGHPVEYGRLPEKEGDTILFVLPSPSGNARRYWSQQPWDGLARLRKVVVAG